MMYGQTTHLVGDAFSQFRCVAIVVVPDEHDKLIVRIPCGQIARPPQ
jgi:hypothetical protein